ncbi:MAG: 4Fe-4S dicluster domain-containing protein [Desulfobacterales bacterium]|nr:4Fe-4S dicluster domain-containing protein [Desulfobacterales bacterium]MCP4159471.1 4Fe-4S dicluster domain-containing protein [Deltaproteobacteria bacterium]
MTKSFFIDTTLCTACRGCQVACKQWQGLPAEKTVNKGSYENPPDLSGNTYKVVRMSEKERNGKLKWFFFPEQCRHCIEAPCLETAEDSSAIYKDKTGAIIFTKKTKDLVADDIISACPYNVPRVAKNGILTKCNMCVDRVHNGLKPACVKTCPTGAMQFGDRSTIVSKANKSLAKLKRKSSKAQLIDQKDLNVIYLVEDNPKYYFKNAIASYKYEGITRQMAIRKIFRPLTNIIKAVERIG